MLFMPGDSLRKITKGTTIAVDTIVMDLEDGVALNRKDEARQTVIEACQTLDFGHRERLIRINPPRTEFVADDMAAVLEAQPDGVVIPKVESAQDLLDIDKQLEIAEHQHSWPAGSIRILALIESAMGVLMLPHIVSATPRLAALMFGAEDLAGDIGAIRTPAGHEIAYARSAVVTAAAAYKIDALDTLFIDFTNPDGLARDCQLGKEMGFCGKMAIHPKQIDIINQCFSPSPEDINHATRLIQAHDQHQAAGTGAFAFEGKMIDMPMIRAAQKILSTAQAISKHQ